MTQMALITEESFTREYSAHYGHTVGLLVRGGQRRDDALDIAQDAWMRAWEKREQWHGIGQLQTWVMVIAWNYARVWHRKRKMEPMEAVRVEPGRCMDVEDTILADQILALTKPVLARHLRQYYIEGRERLSSTERVRLKRARTDCRVALGVEVKARAARAG